jgi:hypothetical protein
MASKQLLTPFLAFFGKHDRLCLPNRIKDHSFSMQPSQGVPIMPFPRPSVVVVNREKEQRENRVVDFILVVAHSGILPFFGPRINRVGGV